MYVLYWLDETLANFAREMRLGNFLLMGKGNDIPAEGNVCWHLHLKLS